MSLVLLCAGVENRDASWRRQEYAAAQILSTIQPHLDNPVDQLRVLDVGSGDGIAACKLATKCREVVGIELISRRVDVARRRAEQLGLTNVRFRCQSVNDLEDRERFHLAILDNVLEHLSDQPAALAAIFRALRPGGLLYILVPNKLWPIEAHYGLPLLSYLPLAWANGYLRMTGRGTNYKNACHAPTYFRLRRLLDAQPDLSYTFVLPTRLEWTAAGSRWYYRWGVAAIKRCPLLWVISKAFLVVARKSVRHNPSKPSKT